jgi:hypothetical protein
MATQLTMKRGDTPLWNIQAYQSDGTTPFDLTGYTLRMTFKRSIADDDADAVFELSTVEGTITLTDAANGQATAQPERSDTSGLTVDTTLYWDLQAARDATTDVTYTLLSGTLFVSRDITRTAP